MFAVADERVVVGTEGAGGADLGGFLTEQRGPESQFTLALQSDRLDIHPTRDDEVLVQVAQLVGSDVADEARVVGSEDPSAVRLDELDRIGNLVDHRGHLVLSSP